MFEDRMIESRYEFVVVSDVRGKLSEHKKINLAWDAAEKHAEHGISGEHINVLEAGLEDGQGAWGVTRDVIIA